MWPSHRPAGAEGRQPDGPQIKGFLSSKVYVNLPADLAALEKLIPGCRTSVEAHPEIEELIRTQSSPTPTALSRWTHA
jgi:hypothetical protein